MLCFSLVILEEDVSLYPHLDHDAIPHGAPGRVFMNTLVATSLQMLLFLSAISIGLILHIDFLSKRYASLNVFAI